MPKNQNHPHSLRFALQALKPVNCVFILLGSAILALGLCHVHAFSGVTEGGVLGLTLFFWNRFSISPAITGAILNLLCYLLGWRLLGHTFILYSAVAGGGFSLFYALAERISPLFPTLTQHPLLSAVIGACFVGVGVGICVCAGGAPSGDDALAMSLSHITGRNIRWIYLFTDLSVLALSAVYLSPAQLGASLLSVILSGQIIGQMQRWALRRKQKQERHT